MLNGASHGVLIVGWIGFNAGSAFGANLRAVMAAWNSNICAAMVRRLANIMLVLPDPWTFGS